ncbi:hypothetical protein, partial [Capnocytophaga catalasegens]|uniref:hypothetical protein n=1 Tax=Capnocytophaga catalasegens TaxID=1004260 RepID=UPI0022326668
MNKSNTYQAHNNQTWLDISLKLYGTPEYAFDLAVANGSSIVDEIVAGAFISYDAEKKANKTVLAIYNNNKTNPATAFSGEDKQVIEKPQGISIWAINL